MFLDGFSAGLPAVVTKAGEFEEVFKNRNIGYLCDIGNIDEIVTHIINLKENKKNYKDKSNSAKQFAKKELESKKLRKKLGDYIKKCLKK